MNFAYWCMMESVPNFLLCIEKEMNFNTSIITYFIKFIFSTECKICIKKENNFNTSIITYFIKLIFFPPKKSTYRYLPFLKIKLNYYWTKYYIKRLNCTFSTLSLCCCSLSMSIVMTLINFLTDISNLCNENFCTSCGVTLCFMALDSNEAILNLINIFKKNKCIIRSL